MIKNTSVTIDALFNEVGSSVDLPKKMRSTVIVYQIRTSSSEVFCMQSWEQNHLLLQVAQAQGAIPINSRPWIVRLAACDSLIPIGAAAMTYSAWLSLAATTALRRQPSKDLPRFPEFKIPLHLHRHTKVDADILSKGTLDIK